MYILGISAFFHDSAACLLKNGKVVAAVQEERFSRIKHDQQFPINAIRFCVKEQNIKAEDIKNVVFYEKPFLKFERLLETYLAFAPRGFKSFSRSMPLWIKEKLFQKSMISDGMAKALGSDVDWSERLLFSEHHLSHAASAFYPSPFDSAAVLTLDGVGEWSTTSLSIGKGKDLNIIKEIHFPHSLGLLYSAMTYFAGFKVNSGEYKLMGLAPYGTPKYADLIKGELLNIADDGSFQLNMRYFDFATGLTMTNKAFNRLFNGVPRKSESKVTQREMDLAASIQSVTNEIVIKLARSIAEDTREKNLCMAGGVALNCVSNGVLDREKIFDQIWIQPAAGDAGGAYGAALAAWHLHYSQDRSVKKGSTGIRNIYLGPAFNDKEIVDQLNSCGAKFVKLSQEDLIDRTTDEIVNQKAVGWFQGKMEFGPRALGNRSIIADPRSEIMQKQLNLKVKNRESFRPFAPSILLEQIEHWFDEPRESPFMLFVMTLKKDKRIEMTSDEEKLFGIDKLNISRSEVPAVTHVDYSGRIQTVDKMSNPLFYDLISDFYKKTGVPMLVNTSFNVRGEPIVCTPTDAFNCFMGTDLDLLVIGNFLLEKSEQNVNLRVNLKRNYELD